MSNINIRVVGTANVTQMDSAFGQLQAQVTALNAQLAQMLKLQNGMDPRGYDRMAQSLNGMNKTYRSAIASTGMFEQQQIRVNKATDQYVDAINRQKLSFRQMAKERKIAAAAYKEQLAMENMVVRQAGNTNMGGKQLLEVQYLREVSSELDTSGRRLAFFNQQLKSGGNQMVNWGKNTQWAGRQLMVGFTLPLAMAGAAAGVLAYQMDKELTRIAKVYDTTADANNTTIKGQIALEKELAELRVDGMNTAMKAAKEYGAAGQDTMNVQAALAATGKQGAELQAATAEVMRISTLGELEYQDSIDATIALQSVFKMSTNELTEAFNYMNAVENATSLETKDFAQAIPIAAAPVKAFGGDIKELGVLLAAMKERGIQATQGANAIKAAMQRLGRPSKQIQEEWTALTGTDITKIFKDSENLIDLFSRIREATADLDNKDQIKAFAGLFGTYQVTRMGALVEGMDDLASGTGQVAMAAELAGASTKELADVADREMKRQAESISGRWDRAFAEMKLQASTLGEPFIVVATAVMTAASKVIEIFNGWPGPVKVAIGAMLGIGAIAGPIVMLTGLFANLSGQGVKVFASLLGGVNRLMGGMQIATTEQRAAGMAAEFHTSELNQEATQAELTTLAIKRMTQAMQQASNQQRINALVGMGMSPGQAQSQVAGEMSRQLAQDRLMAETKIATATAAQTANTKRTAKNVAMMGGLLATTAASFVLMNSESGSTAGNIAKWVFYATMATPILTGLNSLMTSIAIKQGATAAAAGLWGTKLKAAGTLAKAGLAAMATPAGLAVAGATAAIALPLYLLKKNADEIRDKYKEQQEELKKNSKEQAGLVSLTEKWADATGKAYENYKLYNLQGQLDLNRKKASEYDAALSEFRSDEFSDARDSFAGSSDSEKQVQSFNMIAEMINKMGYSADEAKVRMRAFLQATGETSQDAMFETDRLFSLVMRGGNIDWKRLYGDNIEEALNTIKDIDYSDILDDRGGPMAFNLDSVLPQIEAEGGRAGETWAVAFSKSKDKSLAVRDLTSQLTDVYSSAFQDFTANASGSIISEYEKVTQMPLSMQTESMQQEITEISAKWESMLSSQEAFARAAANGDLESVVSQIQELDVFGQNGEMLFGGNLPEMFGNAIPQAQALVASILEGAEISGLISSDVRDFDAYLESAAVGAYNLSETMAGFKARGMKSALDEMEGLQEVLLQAGLSIQEIQSYPIFHQLPQYANLPPEVVDAWKTFWHMSTQGGDLDERATELRTILNILNGWRGLKPTSNVDTAWAWFDSGKTKEEIKDVGEAAEDVERQYDIQFKIKKEDMLDMRKSAMQDTQQAIADEMSDSLDDEMSAALEANQNSWDSRLEAQKKSFERESDRLDAKWERKRDEAQSYWESRLNSVERAIEAEEKAETKRQKMFDAEMERISKLNDAMNSNIDFNVALSTGQFDEAAKIRNDIAASASQTALERAANAGSKKSERKVNSLEGRKENIEKAQEANEKRLDKQEDAEKKHLDKVQEMREKSLQREADADIEATEKMWDARKDALDEELEHMQLNIFKNEAAMMKYINKMDGEYAKFGDKLKNRGTNWSNHISETMFDKIKKATDKMANDNMWKKLGKKSTSELVKGMGFNNMKDFWNFINTGEQGKFGGGSGRNRNGNNNAGETRAEPRTFAYGATMHTGGFVGNDKGSRKGVARGLRGLHSSERMIRAQDGEFVVNRRSAKENAGVLSQMNAGMKFGTGGIGSAGMAIAAATRGLIAGAHRAMTTAYEAKTAASSGFGNDKQARGPSRFVQGPGGKTRPVLGGIMTQGLHPESAIDIGVAVGTPVRAVADGRLASSYDIPGYEPRSPTGGEGYRSYGRVIEINHGSFTSLYAHLSDRIATSVGSIIKGGSVIGRSGNTGNSNGPHLHFGTPGANPYAFLKKGGTIKNDGTPAILHRDERVLTAPLTKKLDAGIDNIYKATKYPAHSSSMADYPYNWFDSNAAKSSAANNNPDDAGSKAALKIGTLNTWVRSTAKSTIGDLRNLIGKADFLALTEMGNKFTQVKQWLAKQNWGLLGGQTRDQRMSAMAYNKSTQSLQKSGMRKLGDKRADIIGGRETRYANYGMFTDKASGRSTWQVAAHTVPAGKGLNAKNTPLYNEQWANLNGLVTDLKSSGAPVFVSGDLNVHKGMKNFQRPGGLGEFASKGVDYVFGDKKKSKLLGQRVLGGMHTDHGGKALMSKFGIPAMATGGNIKWDNTIANLHKNETVLTAPLSKKLDIGLDNLANGGQTTYNEFKIYATDGMDVNALADRVISKMERANARKPGSRSN